MADDLRKKTMSRVKRAVVKIGTEVISAADGRLDYARIADLTRQVHFLRERGLEVVLVSSGAIGGGMGALNMSVRPRRISELQAAAAVGQGLLISAYETGFSRHGYHAAQILLTRDDFDHRQRYLNAANTMRALLALGCVPVVNENDTVGVEEIRFGDNDVLSALVALLIHADLLIILSIVAGLYRDPARGEGVVSVVQNVDGDIRRLASGAKSRRGTGGMRAKLEAIRVATAAGVPVVLAAGREPDVLPRLLSGEPLGTLFLPQARAMRSRKCWLGYGRRPRGGIVVDEGARRALTEGGKSLLPGGIVGVCGNFVAGDLVSVLDSEGHEFARGLVNYSAADLERIKGLRTDAAARVIGGGPAEVIHRDNLALLQS